MCERFGKTICKHKIAQAVNNFKGAIFNTFTNEMVMKGREQVE